ncbi:MAG: chemotaxis protein CheA [Pseudomonadota bacterium]
MSGNPLDTFREESRELLTTIEESLLALENDPGDAETINALFRAAHTIKGTAGVFGFSHVERFTHVVENLLDRVRDGEMGVGGELIALLLHCRDHIEVLIELAVRGEEDVPADTARHGDGLLDQLRAFLEEQPAEARAVAVAPVEAQTQAADVTVIGERRPVVSDNWHISLRFTPDVMRHGLDPLAFLCYLERLGDLVHVETLFEGLPSLEAMDPETCYLGFEIDLASEASKQAIEDVFEFVSEECTLHILPPRAHIEHYASMIRALPEEDMLIGDILVRSGALSPHELEEALRLLDKSRELAEGQNVLPTAPRLGDVAVAAGMVHPEVIDAAIEKQAAVKERKASGSQWLRVEASKLDSLINLVGELVIAGASSSLMAQRRGDDELSESFSLVSRLVEEIRDGALRLRMVQIGETFNRFQRVVRDVSKELGKDIRLEISGAETELDKTVVEKIGDPLMHLVRNAMDHGLESPADRVAAGKPAQGVLRLNAYHDSGSIVIEVSDDGRGLNRERILAKAIERGIVQAGAPLTDNEIYLLIFEPGFSTAEKVTNLSGRGVGMDVVRRNIEALRGSVDISSTPGQGATVTIRMPLTLAIIDGFLVGVGDASYIIPLDTVQECLELGQAERDDTRKQHYINLRGEVLPFLRLGEVFDGEYDREAVRQRENIVVVQYGNQKAGLVVDELMGEFQTVIKPLGRLFEGLRGLSGSTILGSGEVAMILDIPNLIQRAAGAGRGGSSRSLH